VEKDEGCEGDRGMKLHVMKCVCDEIWKFILELHNVGVLWASEKVGDESACFVMLL
jgi:hypothetical protein